MPRALRHASDASQLSGYALIAVDPAGATRTGLGVASGRPAAAVLIVALTRTGFRFGLRGVATSPPTSDATGPRRAFDPGDANRNEPASSSMTMKPETATPRSFGRVDEARPIRAGDRGGDARERSKSPSDSRRSCSMMGGRYTSRVANRETHLAPIRPRRLDGRPIGTQFDPEGRSRAASAAYARRETARARSAAVSRRTTRNGDKTRARMSGAPPAHRLQRDASMQGAGQQLAGATDRGAQSAFRSRTRVTAHATS